ncbi:MAG: 16S rRNA (cytidine(1402)-2'-O)-methyltransferase, partial [Candidatus Neomarinimicrobiota bacterium]
RKKGRRTRLSKLADFDGTVVIFESVMRITKTLTDVHAEFGDRKVAVCRELTKMHEEVLRGEINEVLAALEGRKLKGECVLVIGKRGLR